MLLSLGFSLLLVLTSLFLFLPVSVFSFTPHQVFFFSRFRGFVWTCEHLPVVQREEQARKVEMRLSSCEPPAALDSFRPSVNLPSRRCQRFYSRSACVCVSVFVCSTVCFHNPIRGHFFEDKERKQEEKNDCSEERKCNGGLGGSAGVDAGEKH